MIKSFKYRIYGNKETIQKANTWMQLCCQLYNTALRERIDAYKYQHISLSRFIQQKELVDLKKEFTEYQQIDAQCLQDVLHRLDLAFQFFFKHIKNKSNKVGYPRYKGSNRYDSFTLLQNSWKLTTNKLNISKLGIFKIKLSRPVEGIIKTVTIHRTPTNKWFVIFACEIETPQPLLKNNKIIGIDVGLESFLTDSNGNKINNPRFFNKSHKILAQRQQKLARKKKGSKRRQKAKIIVAKAHEKIANQRRDFNYKVVKELIQQYDTITIENMQFWNSNINGMNKSMRDASWFQFFNILQFKAEEAGREIIKVPAKNTSQVCSNCGNIVPKDLSVRIHKCPDCGFIADRDYNAALNILRAGQVLQQKNSSISS